ncbi:conserved hypothetical protein [Aster yellows witches'-broom phytoplasma AYWB]|uniref:Uncharacterized protein n=1 Tax=Aster yellows witches'-broom phytoplasma (strain AYWB) TaxID=322098 RepID=Q2NJV3_AYWBP|nr:conserved hypothetical protein [Aster yellows witches'-broom phytoplasma AYWB]
MIKIIAFLTNILNLYMYNNINIPPQHAHIPLNFAILFFANSGIFIFITKNQIKGEEMKNETSQGIIRGGWETKSTPNDLVQIKNFLQTLKGELLNITIVSHSKKKNSYQQANYRPKNQTLFVDPQILDEMKSIE